MQINGIKYLLTGSESPVVVKFAGKRTRAGFGVICGSAGQLREIEQAVIFTFTDEESSQFVAGSVFVTDGNGDHWVVEKKQGQLRLFRNRERVADPYTPHYLAKILGFEEMGEWDLSVIATLDTHVGAGEIRLGNSQEPPLSNNSTLPSPQDILLSEIENILPIQGLLQPQDFDDFLKDCEPCYFEYKAAVTRVRAHEADLKKIPVQPESEVVQLSKMLNLQRKIEEAATPLLEPGHHQPTLKANLDKVNLEIRQLTQKLRINDLQIFREKLDWAQLLAVLAREDSIGTCTTALRKFCKHVDSEIKPRYQKLQESLSEIIERDHEVIGELGKSFESLASLVEKSMGRNPMWSSFLSFKRPGSSQSSRLIGSKNRLSELRHLVEGALSHLGTLHNDSHLNSENKDNLGFFKATLERLESEQAKITATKEVLIGEWGFDKDINFNDGLALCQSYGRLSVLVAESDQLEKKREQYRQGLRDLKQLVRCWRELSGSQKNTSLDKPSLLIAEVRGILQGNQLREKKLQQMLKVQARHKVSEDFFKRASGQTQELHRKWELSFIEQGLEPLNIESSLVPTFLSLAKALSYLDSRNRRPVSTIKKKDEILESENCSSIIRLYRFQGQELDTSVKVKFLQKLAATEANGLGIFLVDDKGFATLMEKTDVALAIVRRQEKKPKLMEENVRKPSQLLSKKAQEALEVFKARNRA